MNFYDACHLSSIKVAVRWRGEIPRFGTTGDRAWAQAELNHRRFFNYADVIFADWDITDPLLHDNWIPVFPIPPLEALAYAEE